MHGDAIAPLVLALAIILVVAKLGGDLATRAKQPAVLGELFAGIVLGNLSYLGSLGIGLKFGLIEHFKEDETLDLLARLGAIILLFEVGLQTTVAEMRKVGLSSFLVGTIGVVVPFALGWGVARWLRPDASPYTHAFVGATLTATSVGITARVLGDLKVTSRTESRIVLGAAVIDDLLGLVLLTILSGLVAAASQKGALSIARIAITVGKAVAFLAGALVLGTRFSPRILAIASRLRGPGVLIAAGLALCFFFAWLADALGLAPIVGAFAAGLVLEKTQYQAFVDRGDEGLERSVEPLSHTLVPVFFVLMGMRADFGFLTHPSILGLGFALVLVGIVGKVMSAAGVVERGLDRLSIGIGMIPRGEVGLIFANVGLGISIAGAPLIDKPTYAAIVLVVVVTTLVTPPALTWSLRRARPSRATT